MGGYENLIAAIRAGIKPNGTQAITGQVMQNALVSIISSVGGNATFAGVATPETDPGSQDQNVFWLAFTPGTYANFGGATVASWAVFQNKSGAWVKSDIEIGTPFLGIINPGDPAPANISTKGYYLSFTPGKYFNGFSLGKYHMGLWTNDSGSWKIQTVRTQEAKNDKRLIVKKAIPKDAKVGDIYVLGLTGTHREHYGIWLRTGDISTFPITLSNTPDGNFIAFEVDESFKSIWDTQGADAAAQHIADNCYKTTELPNVPWQKGIRSSNWKVTEGTFYYTKRPSGVMPSLQSLLSPKTKWTLWRRVFKHVEDEKKDKRISIVRSCGFIPNAYKETKAELLANKTALKNKGMGAWIVRATTFEWRTSRHYHKKEMNDGSVKITPKKMSINGYRFEHITSFKRGIFNYARAESKAVFPWPHK